MNTLNITRINELSPYEVWQTSEGDFYFQTDFDEFLGFFQNKPQ